MALLERISGPGDLAHLSADELAVLAKEIREFLVENVSRSGGHLGPNLGVVELTIAMHRVFDSPRDVLLFDTGHQSYVHKLLTGRHNFDKLRQPGGLSGYPSRMESVHDVVENSHASTALSWADGVSRAMVLRGETDRRAVAIIGDGAMTGGMAWEALNNIAQDENRPVVIVLNDNGRSYAPTVGGMVRRFEPVRKLDNLRVNREYEQFMDKTRHALQEAGMPGKMVYGALHSLKRGVKDFFIDAGIFDYLGLKYIGPVDGHNLADLEEALTLAREFGGPVVVHAITEKGRGYRPAEKNREDHFHAIGRIHPETGLPIAPARFGWTRVFADEIVAQASRRPELVGITAAMLRPVGLGSFADQYPDRVIDVGIAEQHALTMAAGLAFQGMHPVVVLYATFLNRGFDQLLMDVALHGSPVTVVLDRAGITGDDGASHNGMWDLSLAAMIPGLRTAVPRDSERLRSLLDEALNWDGPTLLRYPKGDMPVAIPAVGSIDGGDVLFERNEEEDAPRFAVVAVGTMAHAAIDGAEAAHGANVTVIDPQWVLPVAPDLAQYLSGFDGVVTIEDGLIDGGVGSEIERALEERDVFIPVKKIGIHRNFIAHGKRDAILAMEGMTAADVTQALEGLLAATVH